MKSVPGPVTVDDVARSLAELVDGLSNSLTADWHQPARQSAWTCWEVLEHISDSLFFYAGRLVPVPDAVSGTYSYDYRAKRDGGPEGIMFADPHDERRVVARTVGELDPCPLPATNKFDWYRCALHDPTVSRCPSPP